MTCFLYFLLKSVRALMRMTSMISAPAQPQTGFSQNDLFRGFSSIGNKVIYTLVFFKKKKITYLYTTPQLVI